MKKTIIYCAVVFFALTCNGFAAEPAKEVKPYSARRQFAAGEVIVKYKKAPPRTITVSSASKKPVARKLAGKAYKLTFAGREDVRELAEEIARDPDVEYAEPNYICQVALIPNDPEYSLQWGTSRIGASSAWDVVNGDPGIVIAVIDTGVDYNHQDLADNIWVNEKEVPGNGIDDDGNGYVDDVRGWDFVTVPADWVAAGEDPAPPDNDPMDFLGHGTHVSGIAAGRSNNGIGIAGLAWGCRIMPLRAGYLCIDGGGYLEMADIADALHYAADNGADIINMSFGCLFDSRYMREAVNYAHSKGCLMVAASGNVDSYDAGKPFYPAAYDNVIAVSAVDGDDRISIWNMFAFSNFGDFVDLCGPGTSILSTLPQNGYGYASGTSMASPFVAGVAALVKSKHKNWTNEQIEARLKLTAIDVYTPNPQSFLRGKLGAGIVSAKRALGNLSLAITYPKPGSVLGGSVAVKGSASIEDFASYRVECSDVATPDTWVKIIENTKAPVENGLLGIWCVEDPSGQFNLKLTVTNTSGESYTYLSSAKFDVDSEVKISGKPMCGPSPFDPSKGDLLFYYDLNNAADVDIYVYDMRGTLVWRNDLPYDGGTLGEGGSAGENRVFWDGTNSFGETLGNGAYVYMIVANDKGERKIIGKGRFAVVRG